jgi:hypothetical protein
VKKKKGRDLVCAVLIYLLLAVSVSVCQRGRINADFIGYITVSHRVIPDFWGSISGIWSPLFSWLMIPLILLGVPDLIAGRVILLAGGLLYICSLYQIARRFERTVVIAVLVCAVIQAATWATYLLDPDLLAAGLMFAYCATLFAPDLSKKPAHAFGGGVIAGLAYLAKAYMLPFALIHLTISLWMRGRLEKGRWLLVWSIYVAGLLIVAIPWASVVSKHEHRLTFSTAGSSNHANISIENDGFDPLFNPGLVADYAVDPRLEPDWSPFSSWQNFLHQAHIIGRNLNVTLGYLPLWMLLLIGAVAGRLVIRDRARRLEPGENFALRWALVTTVIYLSGYALVIVEARYLVPVIAPLITLSATVLLRGFEVRRAPVAAAAGLIVLVSGQQVGQLVQNAVKHYQTHDTDALLPVARNLHAIAPRDVAFASNRFHVGLTVAYLDERLKTYVGTPHARHFADELESSRTPYYLRLLNSKEPMGVFDDFVPTGWKKLGEVESYPWRAELYRAPQRSAATDEHKYSFGYLGVRVR